MHYYYSCKVVAVKVKVIPPHCVKILFPYSYAQVSFVCFLAYVEGTSSPAIFHQEKDNKLLLEERLEHM